VQPREGQVFQGLKGNASSSLRKYPAGKHASAKLRFSDDQRQRDVRAPVSYRKRTVYTVVESSFGERTPTKCPGYVRGISSSNLK